MHEGSRSLTAMHLFSNKERFRLSRKRSLFFLHALNLFEFP